MSDHEFDGLHQAHQPDLAWHGGWYSRCTCGWTSRPVATTSEGRDAYTDHMLAEMKTAKKRAKNPAQLVLGDPE
jgi:hypothetical protein